MVLSWVRIVGDDPEILEGAFRQTLATDAIVFSMGGIGGTPDDLTREAVARAMGVATERHPEGVEILETLAKERNIRLTDELYNVIEFPAGAELLLNPINQIPGFSIGDHHFMPGFPELAWPMIEWLLDHRYQHLHDKHYVERSVLVKNVYESALTPLMKQLEQEFPSVKAFCLPSMSEEIAINEVGFKGSASKVDAAMQEFQRLLHDHGIDWEPIS